MSAFLPLDELEPTLQSVLAFIDTFDSDGDTSTASNSSCGSPLPLKPGESAGKPTLCAEKAESSVKKPASDSRKSRKAAASRRCQQKKRAELLALRAQAAALEKRLKELQNLKTQDAGLSADRLDKTQKQDVLQLWGQRVQMERQLRLQSETRNRELKAVVARQSRMAETVQGLLSNVTSVVNIEEALRTPPPTAGFSGYVPNLHDAIYSTLATRLSRLYLEANSAAIAFKAKRTNVGDALVIKTDPVTGVPYIEMVMEMCVGLDVQGAHKALMNIQVCHYSKLRKFVTELGTKKETEIELRDQSMALVVNTMSLSRMFEEDDRAVLTFSGMVSDQPTGTTLRFQEQGWVSISRSLSNPQSESVIRSRYCLSPDVESFPLASSPDTDKANVFVLQQMGSVMQTYLQSIHTNIAAQSQQVSTAC